MSKQTSQEYIEEIKQFLADNGIRDGEPMVAGVIGREPTAKEFIDYWSPKLNTLINKLLIEAKVNTLKDLLVKNENQCICQLADEKVCDHNWSLCNQIRDDIEQLQAKEVDKQ